MSSSLVESLQGLVTPALIKTASAALGESEQAVTGGLGSIISKTLGTMVQRSGEPGLMNTVAELTSNLAKDPSGLSDLRGLMSGGIPATAAALAGNQLLGSVFGDKLGALTHTVASAAGIRPASSSSLFSLAAPLVLGAIGKRLGGGALTGAALSSLIGQERNSLMGGFMPSLGGLATAAAAAVAPAVAAAVAPAAPKPVAPAPVAPAPAPVAVKVAAPIAAKVAAPVAAAASRAAAPADNGLLSSFLWLLIPAAFVGWLFWEKMNAPVDAPAPAAAVEEKKEEPATAAVAAAPEPAPAPAAAAPAPEPAAAPAASASGLIKIALSGGAEIEAAAEGLESKILAFIGDPNAAVDKGTWFDFDRLNFETGSTNLTSDSKAQVSNVSAILKAFPEVKVKVGGYTDNVGNPDANVKLSDNRAKKVMEELVGMGVAADRVEAEGYGEQHAVADNSTPEGRAKNRRTAISVRAK
jgi:OmpA-OmpF porin, OOP family